MAKGHSHEGREHASHHDHPEHHLHTDVHSKHHTHRHEGGAHHDLREHHGRGAYRDGARGAPHEDREAGNHGRSFARMEQGDYATGHDAAYVRPFLIPDYELLPRDDSGGPEWQPYTQEWGDGGYVTGMKKHLSPHGGSDDRLEGDEQGGTLRDRNAFGGAHGGPSSSRRMAKE